MEKIVKRIFILPVLIIGIIELIMFRDQEYWKTSSWENTKKTIKDLMK